MNPKVATLLEGLSEAPPGDVVEIGCVRYGQEQEQSEGRSTLYLIPACMLQERKFFSYDIDAAAVERANGWLRDLQFPEKYRVRCRDGVLALRKHRNIAFLYLDGGDDPNEALEQLRMAELKRGAIVAVDDAHDYGGQKYGKATKIIELLDAGAFPKATYRLIDTVYEYKMLLIKFHNGKKRTIIKEVD